MGYAQGCIKLRFPGRGQLVLGTTGLKFQGQAGPATFSSAFGLELDAGLCQRQSTKDLGFRGIKPVEALLRLHLGSGLVGGRGGDAERLVQRG